MNTDTCATDLPHVATMDDLAAVVPELDGDGTMRDRLAVPEDVRHDNTRKAGYAAAALVAYGQATGANPAAADPRRSIADLLADLRHLADALGVDYDDSDETAERDYEAEANAIP